MSYAVMPMGDYRAACDRVREKINTTEVIKSGDIPDKIEQVYKAGQLSVFSSSEALKGNAEGNPVTITDISPVEHNVGVSVKSAPSDIQGGKNLEQTDFGYYKSLPFILEKGKTYTIEVVIPYVGDNDYYQCGYIEKSSWANDSSPDYNILESVNVITSTETAEYCVFLTNYISPAINSQIFVSEEGQGGAGVGGAKVSVCGKNIFNSALLLETPLGNSTGWVYEDGYYRGSGTGLRKFYHKSGASFECPIVSNFAENTQYTLTFKGHNGTDVFESTVGFFFSYTDGSANSTVYVNTDQTEVKLTLTSKAGKTISGLYATFARTATTFIKDIQVEASTTSTEFEEYSATEYTSNADGTVEGVKSRYPSMSFSTDAEGVNINVNYYKDIDKVLNNLAINIALSGGN